MVFLRERFGQVIFFFSESRFALEKFAFAGMDVGFVGLDCREPIKYSNS